MVVEFVWGCWCEREVGEWGELVCLVLCIHGYVCVWVPLHVDRVDGCNGLCCLIRFTPASLFPLPYCSLFPWCCFSHLQHSFWPPVDILGCVGPSAGACSYFLNLGKPTGLPILVFMPAGVGATALEDRSDADTVEVRARRCGCTCLSGYCCSTCGKGMVVLGVFSVSL
jgi:hypothetical protein